MSGSSDTAVSESRAVCVIPTSRMWTALLRSHLLVAAIAVGGLLAATCTLAWLRLATSRSIEVLHHEISYAMQLQADIERTMADLHSWMLTGEEEHKRNRSAAWNAALDLLGKLDKLANQAGGEKDQGRMLELVHLLRELKCQQWWIEDEALTPGDDPAAAMLAESIDPIADQIFGGITAVIDLERSMPPANRRQLLANMADFRAYFNRSHAMLMAVVHQSGDTDIPTFLASLQVAEDRIVSLIEEQSPVSQHQRELIAMLNQKIRGFRSLADQVIDVVRSHASNLAEDRYATQAAPLAGKIHRLLTNLVGDKTYEMQAQQDYLEVVSGWVCGAVFVLACGLSGLAGVLSYRRACAIAGPIQELCKATQQIADGGLDHDIPVTTNDEVAMLTHTFNAMRYALQVRTDNLVRSNNELQLLQERFETLIDFAPVAMIMVDADRKITMINREGEALFGYREDELLGKEIEILIPHRFRPGHPAKVKGYFESPKTRQMGEALELLGLTKQGAEIPIEVGLRPVPVDGELQVLSAIVDSSKRKAIEELEKQLSQAQRLESIGQLAAGVAHEINSPMQFIDSNIGYLNDVLPKVWGTLDLLCERLTSADLPEDAAERMTEADAMLAINSVDRLRSEIPLALTECIEGVTRVVEIVQAMKEMSHPGSEDKRWANMNDIAHSAATVTRNRWKYSAEIQFDLDESMPELLCYPGDLNRVLVNLIVNAADAICDFRDETTDPLGKITLRSRFDEHHAVLEVEDNGGGVPDSVIDRIFDPFFTTKEVGRGSGQGLAICYDVVVNRHAGWLDCQTQPGVGTKFRVTLPFSPVSPVSPVANHVEEPRLADALYDI